MIDEAIIVKLERLRDDLETLRAALRKKYDKGSQISAKTIRAKARAHAEVWLVDVASRPEIAAMLQGNVYADVSVAFQKLLTAADHVSARRDYEDAIDGVLEEFNARVLFPLKQRRGGTSVATKLLAQPVKRPVRTLKSIFVGHSFNVDDRTLVALLGRLLSAYGIQMVTGEKPSADSVSEKVKARIETAEGFLGLYSRREKIARRKAWTTSAWVIDEKAYALAKGKKLILLKEQGVESIGGLQGDYEYLEFNRPDTADLIVRIVELFEERLEK